MKAANLVHLVIALFVGMTCPSCKEARKILLSDMEPDQIVVSEDLGKLAHVIQFRVAPISVRRCSQPMGVPSRAPGPTDYVLYNWIGFDAKGWDALEAAKTAGVDSVAIPIDVARALLPEDTVTSHSSTGNKLQLVGPRYDVTSFLNPTLNGGSALRVGPHLFVIASTR